LSLGLGYFPNPGHLKRLSGNTDFGVLCSGRTAGKRRFLVCVLEGEGVLTAIVGSVQIVASLVLSFSEVVVKF
jgi:hypothetical protein